MSGGEDDLNTLGIEHVCEHLDPEGYGWASGDGPSVEEVVGALVALGWRPADSTPTEREAGDSFEVPLESHVASRESDTVREVAAVAVMLCDTNESWAHHDQTDDHPCLSCKAQAVALAPLMAEREAKAWDEGRSAALAPVAVAPDGTFAKSRYRMRTEDAILALPNPYRTTAEVGE